MMPVRIRRLLLWVALPALILVLLYTVLGFYLVPHLVRSGIHDFVAKSYHREVALGEVRFNPYTLRLDLSDFALPDSDGQPMLSFRHLLVDLTVASIWHWGPDFQSIILDGPFARVLLKSDGSLNFSELALPPSATAKPEPKPQPARLFISRLSVRDGNVAFEDRAHPSEFRTEIKPLNFELRDFATVGKEGGTYSLSGASEAGERFTWSGSLTSNPLASHGQFEIQNLQAKTIWDYLRDSVRFELPSGAISIAGDYDFTSATTPTGLAVNVHQVTVTDLGIRPRGSAEDYIKLARLEVRDTRADVAKHSIDVGNVHLDGGEVRAWIPGAGGVAVNLLELIAPASAPTATPGGTGAANGNEATAPTNGAADSASASASSNGAGTLASGAAPSGTSAAAPATNTSPSGTSAATPATSAAPSSASAATPATSTAPSSASAATPATSAAPSGTSAATPATSAAPSGTSAATPATSTAPSSASAATPATSTAPSSARAATPATSTAPSGTTATAGAPASGAQPSGLSGPAPGTSAAPDGTPPTTVAGTSPAWVVSVPDIALDNLKITGEDRHLTPGVSMQLTDLRIHVGGFTTARNTPLAVTISTRINHSSKLEAKADLSSDFTAVKSQVELADLDLTAFQPYIAERTAMTLRNGLLSTKLNAERAADGNLSVTGELDVAKLRTIDNELKRDFIKFDRLQVADLDYRVNLADSTQPSSLHIHNVIAHAPYARVIIEPDQTTNVTRVLRDKRGPQSATATDGSSKAGAADGTSGADGSAAAPAGRTATRSTKAGSSELAANGAPMSKGGSNGNATGGRPVTDAADAASAPPALADSGPASKSTDSAQGSKSTAHAARGKHRARRGSPSDTPASTPGSMAIAIDAIKIEDGSANYADLWIQPHFGLGIQMLNGTIQGISSDPKARAKVNLEGKVDRYAPIRIWGETNPLAATAYTDIKMSFKGVELSSVTPYSGRFAGYKIEKGKLTADINYRIDNGSLSAGHKFVIDQLELGERVESPQAIHLPLKLAIALLKDRNGVIDLDLPITGSLDDPQFKVGPLIWKLFIGLLEKAATAPFALLGHLFGGHGEEMKYVDFHPGSAVLEPTEHDKLTALAKALKEKEKLELDVPVTFSPDIDQPALATAHLNQRLLKLKQEQTSKGKRAKQSDDAPPSASALMDEPPPQDPALTDPPQRYRLLASAYRAELGKSTPLPDSAKAIEAAGRKKGAQPDFGAANADLEAALLQKMPIPSSELEALGKHRARAIQQVLLVGTDIDPSRVFIIGTAPKAATDKDKVRVELALK